MGATQTAQTVVDGLQTVQALKKLLIHSRQLKLPADIYGGQEFISTLKEMLATTPFFTELGSIEKIENLPVDTFLMLISNLCLPNAFNQSNLIISDDFFKDFFPLDSYTPKINRLKQDIWQIRQKIHEHFITRSKLSDALKLPRVEEPRPAQKPQERTLPSLLYKLFKSPAEPQTTDIAFDLVALQTICHALTNLFYKLFNSSSDTTEEKERITAPQATGITLDLVVLQKIYQILICTLHSLIQHILAPATDTSSCGIKIDLTKAIKKLERQIELIKNFKAYDISDSLKKLIEDITSLISQDITFLSEQKKAQQTTTISSLTRQNWRRHHYARLMHPPSSQQTPAQASTPIAARPS